MPEVNCKQEVRNLIAENLNTDKGDKSDWRRFIHNKIKDYVLTSDHKCTLVTSSDSYVCFVNNAKSKLQARSKKLDC